MDDISRRPLVSVTKKDLKITSFSGKGAGGQHRNKHQNCIRIQHLPSGVMVTGQEERSKEKNLRRAFNRLATHPDFRKWLRIESSKALSRGPSVEQLIDEAMSPQNLKIENGPF
jgi:protein subunit release factor A